MTECNRHPLNITTIKRCETLTGAWYTVENCVIELDDEPNTGITIKYHDDDKPSGEIVFSLDIEDALMIRDAINQLYPPDKMKNTIVF